MPALGQIAATAARHAPARAGRLRRTVGRRAVVGWATLRRTWRQSLQLRMVCITLVVSGLLIGVFGVLVASMITNGLLRDKNRVAEHQVRTGAEVAAQQLALEISSDSSLHSEITKVLTKLAGTPEQGGGIIVAMLSSSSEPLSEARFWPDEADVRPAIDRDLRLAVQTHNQVAHKIITRELDGKGPKKYLVYGSPVPVGWGQAELYYVFPLAGEDAMANRVRTTVAVTGLALVVLLAVVAALVTRLVVRPVRLAARTAQRLSAGLLDQRMEVRGEDDLALLAASFNQMAANLQRQIVRLEEMSRLQRRFTSDVSHELRTPLTTVRMAADLLFSERDGFDPVVARSAELLQLELDRFEALLTDLLEISRFDAGFAMLDAEPTDLVPLVRQVADGLAVLAERDGVAIELDLPDRPVIAEVDSRRVERILRNLVGNALEHGEHHPVSVRLAADDNAVAVSVRDRGIGLRPGEEKLVFNRFWRSDPSRARQTGGTGLGLSISLEDARLHGGWLEAWGAPGQGAQFRLTLPVHAGDRLVSSPLRLVPADGYVPVSLAAPPAPAPSFPTPSAADPSLAALARSAGEAADG
ncbi:MAG TPA: MtrAB system histidine kinase MtrB [Micromonosporaceae bacterium]|nr:MtrAB system histidine kinase MtrB [Micromonosporaceae bacterium]